MFQNVSRISGTFGEFSQDQLLKEISDHDKQFRQVRSYDLPNPDDLPNSVEDLKNMIVDQAGRLKMYESSIDDKRVEILKLEDEVMRRAINGRKKYMEMYDIQNTLYTKIRELENQLREKNVT